MPKTKLTINSKTLFPIDKIKEHIKEAFTVSDTLGPAIITKGNRPAYAIIRIGDDHDVDQTLAEEIAHARSASKGTFTTEPYWWEKG